MKDLAITFNGPNGNTFIDLNSCVTDKNVTALKVLVTLVTQQGTDKLFADKGTNLLKSCIGAVVIDKNAMQHICNFAALNVIYFINDTDGLTADDPSGLADLDVKVFDYDADNLEIKFSSVVYFPDNTKTEEPNIFNIPNG